MAPKPTVTIRLPVKLIAKLEKAAKAESRSVSNYIQLVLESHFEGAYNG